MADQPETTPPDPLGQALEHLDQNMQAFGELAQQLERLLAEAEQDPQARAKLEKLHNQWHGGLAEDTRALKTLMQSLVSSAEYYQTLLAPANAAQSEPTTTPAPHQPGKAKRRRSFA